MRAIIFAVGCFMAAEAGAVPLSVTVGDNDGFGAGIPDNGDGSVITTFQNDPNNVDYRSVAEANATDGAQVTDLYSIFFPSVDAPISPFEPFTFDEVGPDDPRLSVGADILFSFSGQLTTADVTIDFLDWQTDGYITADINGLPLVLGPAGQFSETFVRTYMLTPDQIAAANAAQQVVLTLTLATVFNVNSAGQPVDLPNGDVVAFDFFRLDGELANGDDPPLAVPEPGVVFLLLSGLGCAVLARRSRIRV